MDVLVSELEIMARWDHWSGLFDHGLVVEWIMVFQGGSCDVYL